MENSKCLTATEMAALSTAFIECFESELFKQTPTDKILIEGMIIDFCVNTKLHMLFTQESLKNITENTFNNILFRDFILCLTDQFNCITAVKDLEDRTMIHSIGFGLDAPITGREEYILIPERVYGNMERTGELIINILDNNRWLLTLVLIYLFFQKTNLFNTFSQNNNLTSK